MQQYNTAILFFSRTAQAESRVKKLLTKAELNVKLHLALQRNSLKQAKKTGLPVFRVTEHDQIGDSFGERLANALDQIFHEGYEHVIAIGGDSPNLLSEDLLAAKIGLEKGSAVLGADNRGGSYLIGVSKDVFRKDLFSNFKWQSRHLFAELITYFASKKVEVLRLIEKFDINSVLDLRHYGKKSSVLRLILILLHCLTYVTRAYGRWQYLHHCKIFYRRGPPVFN